MSSDKVTKVDFSQRGRVEPAATIIAVGGGKGGVGKSFVSSSLSIFLAQLGFETLAIDLDLGGANMHTNLGLPVTASGINEFIMDPQLELNHLAQKTHWQKLQVITGASEAMDVANIDELQRSRLMSSIIRYKTDFIVLDLSAGTHQTTLDFFLMAKHKLVVFTPEPSSIENAYRFLKSAFFRKLRRYETQLQVKTQIDELLAQRKSLNIKNPADLMRNLIQREPVLGNKLRDILMDLHFEIVLNQARTRQEADMGYALQSVCNKYFGIPCEFLGALDYDNAVWQALRQRHHLLTHNRQTHLYAQLMTIARKIAKTQPAKAVV